MDRTTSANFLSGGMFGVALLVAVFILVVVAFTPIARTDWPSFVRGAIFVPGMVVLIFGFIGALAWRFE